MPDFDLDMGDSRHQTQLDNLIRLKAAYNGAIMVSHLRADITFNDLNTEIKDMCCFQVRRPWDEGSPLTVSSLYRCFDRMLFVQCAPLQRSQ